MAFQNVFNTEGLPGVYPHTKIVYRASWNKMILLPNLNINTQVGVLQCTGINKCLYSLSSQEYFFEVNFNYRIINVPSRYFSLGWIIRSEQDKIILYVPSAQPSIVNHIYWLLEIQEFPIDWHRYLYSLNTHTLSKDFKDVELSYDAVPSPDSSPHPANKHNTNLIDLYDYFGTLTFQ